MATMPHEQRVIFEDVYPWAISRAILWTVPLAAVSLVAVAQLPNIALGHKNAPEQRTAQREAKRAAANAMGPTGALPTVRPAAGTDTDRRGTGPAGERLGAEQSRDDERP